MKLNPLFTRSRGAALVEYGLLVGLIAVVAIGAVSGLGQKVDYAFETVTGELSSAIGADAAAAGPEFEGTTFGPEASGLAYSHDGYFARLLNVSETAHFDALCAEYDPTMTTYVSHTEETRTVGSSQAGTGMLSFDGASWVRYPGNKISSAQPVVTSLTCRA